MPTKIDFSGVFHNALPMAYIRKVSLSPGLLSEEGINLEERPEPVRRQKDIFGKTKLKSGRKRKQQVKAPPTRSLNVDIEFAIKDGMMSGNRGGTWYDNEQAKQFLKLRVLLCLDRKAGVRLATGGANPKEIKRFITAGRVVEKVISLADQTGIPLRAHRKERVGEDNVAYSVPYRVNFSINEYKPKYLSVFAMTFLETGEAVIQANAFGSGTRTEVQGNACTEILLQSGAIKREAYVFMTPKKEVWAGPVHHNKEKGYMAGAFHSRRAPHSALKRQPVRNIVVSDYRLLENANMAELQLLPFSNAQQDDKRKKGRSKTPERNRLPKKESYASDLYGSRNSFGDSNFVFHVDFEKLIREKSQFGSLVDIVDKRAKRNILSKSRIRNIRVFRHRVQKGLRPGRMRDASFEERSELVAMTSEFVAGNIIPSLRESHSDEESTDTEPKPIGAIREVSISGRTRARSFSVSDYDVSRRTDGLYQYSIDFDIEDGTVSFAQEQLQKLIKARTKMRQYYNLSMQKGHYNARSGMPTRKFRRRMKKRYPVPSRLDVMSGRKIDRSKLVKQGISRAPWVKSVAVYADVLFNLTDINEKKASELAALLYEMSNPSCGNPTGTLTVLEMMESLEGKIKGMLGTKVVMMDEFDYPSGVSIKGSSVQSSRASRPAIRLRHRFKDVFDGDILKNTGYDFLGGSPRRQIGIRRIPLGRFRRRIQAEQKKHFASPSRRGSSRKKKQNFNLKRTKTSYLSPAAVMIGENSSYDLLKAGFNRRVHQNAMSAVMALRPDAGGRGKDKLNPNPSFLATYKSSEEGDISGEEVASNIMNMVSLANLGISFEDPEVHKRKRRLRRELGTSAGEMDKGKISIGASIGSLNIVSDEEEPEEEAIEEIKRKRIEEKVDLSPIAIAILSSFAGSSENLFNKNVVVKTIDAFDLESENNIVERFLQKRRGKTRTEVISKMPNQIKSLFMTSDKSTNQNWQKLKRETGVDIFSDPTFEPMIYFNYQMLNQIEVFIGYKRSRSTGEQQLKTPTFVPLTEDILSKAEESNRTLLCRMRPYNNAMFGFSHSSRLRLPIFDEHFFISSRKSRKGSEDGIATDLSEGSFINRISDRGSLNLRGIQALESIVEISMLEDSIMPEYLMTDVVQQPNRVTKFGTNFGEEKKPHPLAVGKSSTDVLDSLSAGKSPKRRGKSSSGKRARRGRSGGMSSGDGGGSY